MSSSSRRIAGLLLQIKAIKLEPSNPFTWSSGWRSPIYCDNRKVLSYPSVRRAVYESLSDLVSARYPDAGLLAGVATGGIAHGVLAAERLGLPFVYVRGVAKSHGLSCRVEGCVVPGSKVVVVEDLVSTGGSSLSAVSALRDAGVEVLGMVALFTYGFPEARARFARAGVTLDTLSDYETLISLAVEQGFVSEEELEVLRAWRRDPSGWLG